MSSPVSRLAAYLVVGKALGVMLTIRWPREFVMLRAAIETVLVRYTDYTQMGPRLVMVHDIHTSSLVPQIYPGRIVWSAAHDSHSGGRAMTLTVTFAVQR